MGFMEAHMYSAMQSVVTLYYQKILRVDLTDDSYEVLRSDNKEFSLEGQKMNESFSDWVRWFANSSYCHPDDSKQFLRFSAIEDVRKELESRNQVIRLRYRRKYKDDEQQWHPIHLELVSGGVEDGHSFAYLFVSDVTEEKDKFYDLGIEFDTLAKKSGEGYVTNKRKIVYLDSSEENIHSLRVCLGSGYEIMVVKTADEILKAVDRYGIELDLIILNMNDIGYEGGDLITEVKKDVVNKIVPFLAVAGLDDRDAAQMAITIGTDGFIPIPYERESVVARINHVIELKDNIMKRQELEIDKITGLYTREAFFQKADNLLANNPDKSYDIVVATIDNLGLINQQYGEKTAYEVVKHFASLLRNMKVLEGICSRVSDNIFACIARHTENMNIERLGDNAQSAYGDTPVSNVVLKYGMYLDVDHAMGAAELYQRGYAALESIRGVHGKNVAFYDQQIILRKKREREFLERFDEAVNNKEFEVWFQPKYNAVNYMLEGAEALVRWRRKGVIIGPGEFVPHLEKGGRIKELDEYVFEEVCKFQKNCLDTGQPVVPISVNLSRASMSRLSIADEYTQIAERIGVPHQLVPIEITEGMAVNDDIMKPFVDRLMTAGFPLHMDDFGTGYSSLSCLNTLHFDVIKLDKSLIDYIGTPTGDSLLIHTIAYAKESGKKVVAEGVENEGQLLFLKNAGCDSIQGFYFSKPIDAEAFKRLKSGVTCISESDLKNPDFIVLDRRRLINLIGSSIFETDMMDRALGAIAVYEVDGKSIELTSANNPFLDIFGIGPAELSGYIRLDILSLVEEPCREDFLHMFYQAEHNPKHGSTMQIRFRDKKGKLYVCLITTFFLRYQQNVKIYYSYVEDQTEIWRLVGEVECS